jgi:hypothetical protein
MAGGREAGACGLGTVSGAFLDHVVEHSLAPVPLGLVLAVRGCGWHDPASETRSVNRLA